MQPQPSLALEVMYQPASGVSLVGGRGGSLLMEIKIFRVNLAEVGRVHFIFQEPRGDRGPRAEEAGLNYGNKDMQAAEGDRNRS